MAADSDSGTKAVQVGERGGEGDLEDVRAELADGKDHHVIC